MQTPMSPEIIEMLCAQVGHEFSNAMAYRRCSIYFDLLSLDGLKTLMRKQYEGELEHANMIIDYLADRGYDCAIPATIPPPPVASPLEAFNLAAMLEQQTTASLYTIWSKAFQVQDGMTVTFLIPMLDEQREEEKLASDWVTRAMMAESNPAALLEIDELAGD